ncbi:MAG: J domain-containing protein [Anaerolineaceae bacterium]|nr:J domain-containing protein [Anaerolineaceae bacterium]
MQTSLVDARLQEKKGFLAAFKGRGNQKKGEQILVLIEETTGTTQVWVFSKTAQGKSDEDWQINRENVETFEIVFQQLANGIQEHFTPQIKTANLHETKFDSQSPYEILGISPNAHNAEILKAYRALVKQYHPDQVRSMAQEIRMLAEERMKTINLAFREIIEIRNQ